MTSDLTLDDNQIDQLKELVNLAMGDGAKALGNYTQRFVVLSVPQISNVSVPQLPTICRHLEAQQGHRVLQRFDCLGEQGAILLLISQHYLQAFAEIMDRDCKSSADQESLLAQLAGLLYPVILPRLAKELGVSLKAGEMVTLLHNSDQALALAGLEEGAYNLSFSYALEAPMDGQSQSNVEDPLTEYRLAKSDKPALGLDVVIRAQPELLQMFSEKFALRLEH